MTFARSGDLAASEIIRLLGMKAHPEGGHYAETFRAAADDARAASTAIYYLLQADEVSAWHRVDADEHWLWHAGGPLALTISENGCDVEAHRLGPNIAAGEHPQIIVPRGAWQTAEPLGRWTLVGCTVAPGFDFSTFEMAPADWRPMPRPRR